MRKAQCSESQEESGGSCPEISIGEEKQVNHVIPYSSFESLSLFPHKPVNLFAQITVPFVRLTVFINGSVGVSPQSKNSPDFTFGLLADGLAFRPDDACILFVCARMCGTRWKKACFSVEDLCFCVCVCLNGV